MSQLQSAKRHYRSLCICTLAFGAITLHTGSGTDDWALADKFDALYSLHKHQQHVKLRDRGVITCGISQFTRGSSLRSSR
jgi:hypothetical protein